MKDKEYLHTVADRIWEWAKQADNEDIKSYLKQVAGDMHDKASKLVEKAGNKSINP